MASERLIYPTKEIKTRQTKKHLLLVEKNLWQKESFLLLAACARLIGFSHKFFRQIGVRPICLLLHHRHQHLWLLEPTLCCEKGTPASNQVRTIVWLSRAPRPRALIHLRVHTHTQTHHGFTVPGYYSDRSLLTAPLSSGLSYCMVASATAARCEAEKKKKKDRWRHAPTQRSSS